jgi:hypothetical protein
MLNASALMKYLLVLLCFFCLWQASAQSDTSYMTGLAAGVGIHRPVPVVFASRTVRVPIRTDSLSMVQFHTRYIRMMQSGTVLTATGALLVVAHILVVAYVPHYNRNAVISAAAIGVSAMSPGSLVLPIGASFRHRYKKSIRIALAKEGL